MGWAAGFIGSLGFRIAAPVILMVVLLGAGLYHWVLSAISDFAHEQIKRDLGGISRELFNICNRGFDDLMLSGKMLEPEELAIQHSKTLGAIHEYLRQRDLEGLVLRYDTGQFLLETSLPAPPSVILKQLQGATGVTRLALHASHYYAFTLDFPSWKWRLIPIKSAADYAELTSRVSRLSLFTLGLLLAMALVLVGWFLRAIRRPITAMVESLKRGRSPNYRGVREFEFLSESIAGMMDSLNRSEERYRAMFSNAVEGIFQVTPQGTFINANPSVARICGYDSPAELMEEVRNIQEQLVDNPQVWLKGVQLLLQKGNLQGYEERFKRKDGTWGMVSLNARVVKGANGEIEYLEGSVTDITERKMMEQALRENEERQRRILDSIAAGIVLVSAADRRVVYVNTTALNMLHTTRPEALGRPCREVICPGDTTCPMGGDGQAFDCSELILRPGLGDPITVMRTVVPIQMGHADYYLETIVDISDRKNLERQLAQAQKMEAIGTLSGGIAHDFNNILQTIGGYVQLMRNGDGQGPLVEEALGQIEGASRRATNLVKRLLTFGRKVEPELRPVNLNREVLQTAKILQRTLPKMITVQTDLDPDLWSMRGDVNQLEQVMLNLGTNAGDAMPEGGRLVFSTSNQTVDQEYVRVHPEFQPGNYILLTVSDTGQGMEPGHLKQIFDPFFTTKPVGKGTGLGLATVYGIVNNHGGHVLVESTLGQGTTFSIYWPAEEGTVAEDPSGEGQGPEPPLAQGETLLVVDDEAPILKVAREFLESEGYRVVTASSGEQAVETFKTQGDRIQAVVMDLGMPGMGGAKALSQMVAHDPKARVIIASGYVDDAQVQRCLELGAREFLKKPYQLKDLLAALGRVLH